MGHKCEKYNEAASMYDRGLSIGDLSCFYGITRQAMHMILKRRGVSFRSNLKYGKDNHFYRGGAVEKGNANDVLEKALLRGTIEKKAECEHCGGSGVFSDGRSGIQAHHPDYNKPLDVIWLCQRCHHEEHKINKPVGLK